MLLELSDHVAKMECIFGDVGIYKYNFKQTAN